MNTKQFLVLPSLVFSFFVAARSAQAADLYLNQALTSDYYRADGSIIAQNGCEVVATGWAWFVASSSVKLEPGFRVAAGGEFGVVIGGYQDLPQALDYDGNGLPDWWELYYLGDNGQDPEGDPDGDGIVNRLEFRFDTNPMDSGSKPAGVYYGYDAFGRITEIFRFPTP